MIGVTGASGHLGQALLALNPDLIPIGRTLPKQPLQAIIHTAAPNWRDDTAVALFDDFNQQLTQYINRNHVQTIINIGSWWQYAEGQCSDLPYTILKHRQIRALTWGDHHCVNLIPYSIYGDQPRTGRGFIPQLVEALAGRTELAGLSNQPRDWIHVTDVARACLTALNTPSGTFTVSTRNVISPRELAEEYRLSGPDYDEYPSAIPRYFHDPLPDWQPQIELHAHIRANLTR